MSSVLIRYSVLHYQFRMQGIPIPYPTLRSPALHLHISSFCFIIIMRLTSGYNKNI